MDRLTRAIAQVPAVPDDVDSIDVEKASGVVELPLHIRWSGPPRQYDLADRQQRASVRRRGGKARYAFQAGIIGQVTGRLVDLDGLRLAQPAAIEGDPYLLAAD